MQRTCGNLAETPTHFNGGKASGVAYDTAWVARITDEQGTPLFPQCTKWLLENQNLDGSWGSQVLNYHDRIISTLSALIALQEIDEKRYKNYIQMGETYIWETIHNLYTERCKLVGSELLLPSLMEQAQSVGLNLPYRAKIYQKEYFRKLSKIDEALWYSPLTTLSHSLEFLGDQVDVNLLTGILLTNGCVGNSPAATAFYLKHTRDTRAFKFLKQTLQTTGDGSVMTVYPINVFEYLWTTYNLMNAGLYFERFIDICDFLQTCVGSSGVGMSTEFPIPDADDTSILCKILHEMQYPVDFTVLDIYDAGDYYATYAYELDPSVSTNVHVLDCVQSCREFPDRENKIEKLVRFLKREMHSQGYWTDKWHISPYYPTCHAIFAMCNVAPSTAEKAVSYILETQHENGLWGKEGGTLEETAYAMQALLYYHQQVEHIDLEILSKAMAALNLKSTAVLSANLPDLWTGKVLYTPKRIVWSSIASARFMAEIEKSQIKSLLWQ